MKALTIPGLTTDDDVRWLAKQAATHKTIIEIGPFKGRSTRALADATQGIVYALDNWNANENDGRPDTAARAAFYRNCRDLIVANKVMAFEHDSQAGLPEGLRGVKADMLWVDGEHTYQAVRSDLATFAPLVRKGGLVCGHDYCAWHPDVVRAVNAVYGKRVRTISIHRSIWWVSA